MNIYAGDNLDFLRRAVAEGRRYDLIEIDGPYMAGLEPGWDDLTPTEYVQHYAERFPLIRNLLNPWGAAFFFGFPEGCSRIAAWNEATETLYLRRWLHWHKHMTKNMGRKIEVILFFLKGNPGTQALQEFGAMLRAQRESRGWTLRQVQQEAQALGYLGAEWWNRGGNLYFETASGSAPSGADLSVLAEIFKFDPNEWAHVVSGSYPGLTDVDIITADSEPAEGLNEAGLRSKPINLYNKLFTPVFPATPTPRALVLYGGSGNAGISAESLGYSVDICELDPDRVQLIKRRADKHLPKWTARAQAKRSQQKLPIPEQLALI